MTSTVDVKDETRSRPIQKAKVNLFPMAMLMHFFQDYCRGFYLHLTNVCPVQIEILLSKTEKFDELMAAAAEEREAAEAEEQS